LTKYSSISTPFKPSAANTFHAINSEPLQNLLQTLTNKGNTRYKTKLKIYQRPYTIQKPTIGNNNQYNGTTPSTISHTSINYALILSNNIILKRKHTRNPHNPEKTLKIIRPSLTINKLLSPNFSAKHLANLLKTILLLNTRHHINTLAETTAFISSTLGVK
jgi:hypothetical protein